MLNKLIIGTANFIQPYGILSNGLPLRSQEIHTIINFAARFNINEYDTAFAYGDLLTTIHPQININNLKIITKFSVLENYQEIFSMLQQAKKNYSFKGYDAILVHDPQNLKKINTKKLIDFFACLRQEFNIQKIGVSVYDLKDVATFKSIIIPNIIQIPFNPLNQTFNNEEFLNYINKNNIEIQARSLFLQGILLSDKLPKSLNKLNPIWEQLVQITKPFPSKLHALLSWANSFTWINKWVFGIASLNNLEEIIAAATTIKKTNSQDIFNNFKDINHSLIDPRNWN